MGRSTFRLSLVIFCLILSSFAPAHAEDFLSKIISSAQEVVSAVLDIAKKHQNEINKEQMRPLVGKLEDAAESLGLSNRALESSVNRALQNTKINETVPAKYANRVRQDAREVNRGNKELLQSLNAIKTYLNQLHLEDGSGNRLNSGLSAYRMQLDIAEKIQKIQDIEDAMNQVVTKQSKNALKETMKAALTKIDKVIATGREIYTALED